MTIKMTTTGGEMYTLDDDGTVLARTNGPAGFDYGNGWRILGFRTRYNAHAIVSLDAALDGADTGQGWVVDLDHGTVRQWMGLPGRMRQLLAAQR